MATITDTTTDANGNIIVDVSSSENDPITLATAGNYSDKNIIFNLAIQKGAAEPILQEKTVTYTSNGTNTVTPDSGYDGLSSVDVTVNVASGGGGGAGFKVTFPATAKNWGALYVGSIVQANGTVIDMLDYSTLAGKTIPNVIEICFSGNRYYYPYMKVQTGKIMTTRITTVNVQTGIAVDGEFSMIYMDSVASLSRWIPLADTVISSIEIVDTES